MFNGLRKMRELKREEKQAAKAYVETDETGREIVRMRVQRDDGFLSPYSLGDSRVISSDVADFLDNAVKPLTLKRDISLVVSSDEIDDEEKTEYRAAVKNHYRNRSIDVNRRLKNNGRASLIMALIGAGILALYVALGLREVGTVFLEIIDITAWVFMWEAVDLFFFERNALKIEKLRCLRLRDAEIVYKPLTEKRSEEI